MNRPQLPGARAADALLAAVLLVVGQVELVSEGMQEWWRHAVAVGGTVPLAFRRVAPIGVLLLGVGALSVLTLQGDDTFTVGQLVALMVATYSVAAACSAAVAGAGLALTIAAAFANSAAASSNEPGDYAFAVILLGAPWLAGVGVRRWRLQAQDMRELVGQLEAERAEHSRLVLAAERGRIARDLHDSLAQALNAVVVHAEAAEEALGRDDGGVRHSLRRIQDVGRASLDETRQLLHVLRAPESATTATPRLADLQTLVESYVAEGLDVVLDRTGEGSWSPSVEATAYRIVQEGLTNVRRHAPGSRVCVSVREGTDLVVEVRDDGAGGHGTDTQSGTGYGLLGMRERVGLLGGSLHAGREGAGFVVRATLPKGARS